MSDYVPVIPHVDLATRLLTYRDAVEIVLDRYDRPASGRDLRLARRAVLDAYDELPRRHEWTWLSRVMHIAVSPVYDTGTVAYDHTGGTYERELTLTDGTWPTDAAYGFVVIDNEKWYAVEDRKSATVLTLMEDSNPGADIAAGETYWWMRETYPLPPDFWRGRTPLDSERGTNIARIAEIPLDELLLQNRCRGKYTNADTYYYAYGADSRVGANSIILGPPLTDARTLTIPYQSAGRPLRVYDESTGTVTTTADSAVVTGSGTAFTSDLIGSVFRISGNTRPPTSASGSLEGDYNPPSITRIVKSVSSATSLTLDSIAGKALSDVAYSAGDPLDIDVPTCGTVFAALVDYHFVRSERGLISDERAALIRQAVRQVEERELPLAKDADNRSLCVPPSPVWQGSSWSWPFDSLRLLPPG